MFVELGQVDVFKLLDVQSPRYGVFGKNICRWARNLVWRLLGHNQPMHQIVEVSVLGQKVRGLTNWALMRHYVQNFGVLCKQALCQNFISRDYCCTIDTIICFPKRLMLSATMRKDIREIKRVFEGVFVVTRGGWTTWLASLGVFMLLLVCVPFPLCSNFTF